jgi:dynein heavy chain
MLRYRVVAIRGKIIYFTINDMKNIDSMYIWSLEYFFRIFNKILKNS